MSHITTTQQKVAEIRSTDDGIVAVAYSAEDIRDYYLDSNGDSMLTMEEAQDLFEDHERHLLRVLQQAADDFFRNQFG